MFAKKTLLLPADNFRRQSSPSRRGQTSRLFEAAGEVALMRETGIGGDLRQLAAARDQAALGFVDLAAQQEMLGCLADDAEVCFAVREAGGVDVSDDLAVLVRQGRA